MPALRSGGPVVWWIRRDLRLADNRALDHARASGGPVVPVFVLDPALLDGAAHRHAARRQGFLFAGLRSLAAGLRERGSRLVVRRGRPADVLGAVAAETGAAAVVAEEDVSPYARRRDAGVARVVPLTLLPGVAVHHPRDVVKSDGTAYTVFTPFSRAWRERAVPRRSDLIAAPRSLPAPPAWPASDPMPPGDASAGFPAGEAEAARRLRAFAGGAHAPIRDYAEGRNRLDVDGTSALSPYLRFGMVSARQAVVAALAAGADPGDRSGPGVWLSELVWREFYLAILWHYPSVLRGAFNTTLRAVAWRDDPLGLRAWQEGRTGYPIVDAAMRQLATTGWMHNRARMLVASFLTKDLLIDWRAGEAWFMRQLLDGDPAANNGGWQWTAGTGTDAAPYFRVFNPILQANRFDPDGAYVRRLVPELARVPARAIHEPWRLSPLEQHAAGMLIGRDYPAPILDHRAARERALAAYRAAQGRT